MMSASEAAIIVVLGLGWLSAIYPALRSPAPGGKKRSERPTVAIGASFLLVLGMSCAHDLLIQTPEPEFVGVDRFERDCRYSEVVDDMECV